MAPAVATYTPRDPSSTVLYHVIAEHLETLLASLHADPEARGLPAYVEREFYDDLRFGVPVSTGSPSTPTPLTSPIGAISWNISSAIPPVVRYLSSA